MQFLEVLSHASVAPPCFGQFFSTCYCDLHVYQVSPLNFVHFDGQGTSDCFAIHTALGCQFDYSNLTLKESTVVIYLKV